MEILGSKKKLEKINGKLAKMKDTGAVTDWKNKKKWKQVKGKQLMMQL